MRRSFAAQQHEVPDLPDECLVFLLGSRYCETDRLADVAWDLFGNSATGAERVQAICDYVHHHIVFGYEHARPTKTAWDAFNERAGVCRDFAHLAITFCRCMNIPARYCTGYLGDIGVPPPYGPMDFAAWFEAYIGGQWYTFDPRNNVPRIGRVLMARGRDATDVAISHHVRSEHAGRFQGVDRRDRRRFVRFRPLRPRRPAAAIPEPAALRGRLLTVRHLTVYRYSAPVGLGEHRMMFRPRASHDLRIVSSRLEIRPHPVGPALAPRRLRQFGRDRHVHRDDARAAVRQHHHAGALRRVAARVRARGRRAAIPVPVRGR